MSDRQFFRISNAVSVKSTSWVLISQGCELDLELVGFYFVNLGLALLLRNVNAVVAWILSLITHVIERVLALYLVEDCLRVRVTEPAYVIIEVVASDFLGGLVILLSV